MTEQTVPIPSPLAPDAPPADARTVADLPAVPTGAPVGGHAEHGADSGHTPRHATDRDEIASRLVVEHWAALAELSEHYLLAAGLRAV